MSQLEFTPTHPGAPPSPVRDLQRAAEALESAFLAEMFKSAKLFEPSQEMGGGAGEAQFTSFLADEHARAIVANGGIGIAEIIQSRLQSQQMGGS